MAVAVPRSFDDITASWLDEALREGGVIDAAVSGVVVDPMDESRGLIGDLAVLHLEYAQGAGPDSMVVKLPAARADSRQIGDMLNAFGREAAFYRQVAPRSPGARVPRCYYIGEDAAASDWALIIEHIKADNIDAGVGATEQQARAAVDALADFHAAWWEADDRFDWMPGLDGDSFGRLQGLWLENLPRFVDRYERQIPEPTAEWVLEFAPRLADWSAAAGVQPLTMVHSDYRVDNLLFVGNEVTMIDWQTTMRAPAAMDLSCFLTTSLDIPLRRRYEESIIDGYLDRIESNGVSTDREWFAQSYDENILWWMGQFGNNLAHLDPPNPTMVAALSQMVERVYTAGLDRNVGRLL